ncbi:MAG: cytochrome c biogenesis protein CcdA [Clostridia bacterium]|nr:cytochrome c biogenesis protein CcdA [Clostridia bacterium]
MQYIISFLEGIITFISPCLLPMIPIYVTYFVGTNETNPKKTLKCSLGFVLGFTIMFVLMGALAGTLGAFLIEYKKWVNIVLGLVVIFFGLNYIGVFNLNLFRRSVKNVNTQNLGFFSSMVFGIVFSVGWTPCVGAFLGSALMLASLQGSMMQGTVMLICYSLGLGIPFVLSAVLINKLKSTFDFIKRNYKIINTVCGCLLIVIGLMMAVGLFGKWLSALA